MLGESDVFKDHVCAFLSVVRHILSLTPYIAVVGCKACTFQLSLGFSASTTFPVCFLLGAEGWFGGGDLQRFPVRLLREFDAVCVEDQEPIRPVCYSFVVPFYYVGFQEVLASQCLVYVEAKVLSVALSVWFHYNAVAKGGCLDTPPQC